MTLREVIRAIENTAAKQPDIKMIVRNDVFRLNECSTAKYGVFAWLQGQHSTTLDSSLMRYTFTLFYVDRLRNDRANEVEIQSVGVTTLDNIIRSLSEAGIVADGITFQTFNQRFLDECAGVFCNVTFEVPVGTLCPEDYADYSEGFDDDFLIF